MAATVEWEIPFKLTTPMGELLINQLDPTVGGYYMLDPVGCSATRDMRTVRTAEPQRSGEILHPGFTFGYAMTLKMSLWQSPDEQACESKLVEMWDFLMLHLNAIINQADGRLQWSPSGAPVDRMLNGVQILQFPTPTIDAAGIGATFTVYQQLPYALDAPQTTTDITSGATVVNGGTADLLPVIQVHGPTSGFTITNTSVVDEFGATLKVVYDASLPGAAAIASGHYAEIVFGEDKVTYGLDGGPADLGYLNAGIDVEQSDFWTLVPGSNVITFAGSASLAEMLWQNAWA